MFRVVWPGQETHGIAKLADNGTVNLAEDLFSINVAPILTADSPLAQSNLQAKLCERLTREDRGNPAHATGDDVANKA